MQQQQIEEFDSLCSGGENSNLSKSPSILNRSISMPQVIWGSPLKKLHLKQQDSGNHDSGVMSLKENSSDLCNSLLDDVQELVQEGNKSSASYKSKKGVKSAEPIQVVVENIYIFKIVKVVTQADCVILVIY